MTTPNIDNYKPYPSNHLYAPSFEAIQFGYDSPQKKTQSYTPPSLPVNRPPHGGLYTSSSTGKPWHSIPVKPDVTYMLTQNLQSANPPPGVSMHYIGTNRPGNNTVEMPNVVKHNPQGMSGMYDNIHLLNN